MPKTRPAYPERFRREALELVRQGRSIPDVARPDAADRAWGADIKQIRTGEGWLYLAAVQDLFSRRIVGWAMGMRSPVEYEADHAAADPDGLARLDARAGARAETVHNLRLCTATTTTT
ncbi:MAG: putative transposase [Solirubrobacteraceae bacterium]|jgi:transposase InsO family protein|nr:putative transposase [Solirubrobacteraceae bacterium]